ncbi:S41 family peptidase [Shewanella aestuarii]|uniref:S41 family peptidase n=1 Tax=Shewanella aestuarii TaxID=1028752 RepID=A0A6G9QPL2_9GAMM|nr:S41 family peptidase [Shewanella aestuarii]QIR16005.1 S41 family peptidase [Shewanella aestuarii]
MHHTIRNIGCFVLGVCTALSISLSSSEHTQQIRPLYQDYDYPLLMDVIDTIETYYVDKVDRQQLIHAAINGIFTELDPYSVFLNQQDFQAITESSQGEYFGFGFEVASDNGQITIITPFKNSPAERANIKPGDTILSFNHTQVNAQNLQGILTDIRRHSINNQAISLTLKPANTDVIKEVFLQPDTIHIESINSEIIADNIGYIHLTNFQEDATEAIAQQAAAWQHLPLKGIILDIRNNPGGLLDQAVQIADLFLSKGRIVSTSGRFFDANEDYYASAANIFTGLPMVVLINKGSASASEVLAAALQENQRAILIGETSFGKGTVQSLIPMLGQSNAIKLTIAQCNTPNGNNINSIGIEPDIKIAISAVTEDNNMSIIDSHNMLEQDYDQQIDSAIKWFNHREPQQE